MIHAFSDFELDTQSFELRRRGTGELVTVEPQVFDVLRYLVEHPDRVVTKEELQDEVWGTRFVTESAVTSRIKSARRAVDDDGRAQRIIRTVHGRGYRVVVPVMRPEHGAGAAEPVVEPAVTTVGVLERDRELALLHDALLGAEQGTGSVVLVSGEPGIGKTSLVRAFAEVAVRRGTRVLVGGCDDMATPRTLGPLRDIASELGPAVAAAFDHGAGLDEVLAVLPGALAGPTTVLVLEDLHWADDATLDLVRFLGRRAAATPTVLVLTYRATGVDGGKRLRRVLGSLTGAAVRRIELAPLTRDAVAALAGDHGPPADHVFAITRGNPFFVSEVLAAGDLVVPPTVRDAVLARVDALGPPAHELLASIAVMPYRVERWLAGAIAADIGVDADAAATEAEHAGVLSCDEHRLWFRHELARQAVEDSLPTTARLRAHQRALAALGGRDGVEPSRLVHHAESAGDWDAIVSHAPAAAAEAIRLGSYSQAIHHLELLLAAGASLPDRVVARAASDLAYANYVINRFQDSDRYGRLAMAAAERAGDPELLAGALIRFSRTAYWSEGPRAAGRVIDGAMRLLEELGDRVGTAAAHAEYARAHSDLVEVGPVAEPDPLVLEHAERSLELADELDSPYLRCHALQYRGTGRLALGDARGLDDVARAVQLARVDPRDELPVRACVNAAGGSYRFGRLEEAERYVAIGLDYAEGGEFTAGAYRLELTLQGIRMSRGDWNEAEVGLQALVDWPGDPGLMQPLAAALLCRLLARRGRIDPARRVLAPALDRAAGSDEIALVGPVTTAAVELAWLAGDVDSMPAIARTALELADEVGRRTVPSELARYLRRAGHDVAGPPAPVGPWAAGLAGRWAEAASAWEALGNRYERALERTSSDDAADVAAGIAELTALGATATVAALEDRTRR